MTPNKAALLFIAVLLLSAPEVFAFCTIAGNCEPRPEGKLIITVLGKDKPETGEFTVYTPGKPASPGNIVLRGVTGKPVELLVGSYDVMFRATHPLWARNVVIEKDQTTTLEMGGFGELLVSGNDSNGKPENAGIVVYVPDSKYKTEDIIIIGTTNQPLQVISGIYDIRADLSPDVWFRKISIARGETTRLQLPEPSSLRIEVADPDGKPYNEYVFIQGLGDRSDIRATRKTNADISMAPGRYDIRVALDPDVWFRNIEIVSGKSIKLDIPQRGSLLVRKNVPDVSLNEHVWVYARGDKNDVLASGKENKPIILGPGDYDVKVKIASVWQYLPVSIASGKTTRLEIEGK